MLDFADKMLATPRRTTVVSQAAALRDHMPSPRPANGASATQHVATIPMAMPQQRDFLPGLGQEEPSVVTPRFSTTQIVGFLVVAGALWWINNKSSKTR